MEKNLVTQSGHPFRLNNVLTLFDENRRLGFESPKLSYEIRF